jgi:hypothetical protein
MSKEKKTLCEMDNTLFPYAYLNFPDILPNEVYMNYINEYCNIVLYFDSFTYIIQYASIQ